MGLEEEIATTDSEGFIRKAVRKAKQIVLHPVSATAALWAAICSIAAVPHVLYICPMTELAAAHGQHFSSPDMSTLYPAIGIAAAACAYPFYKMFQGLSAMRTHRLLFVSGMPGESSGLLARAGSLLTKFKYILPLVTTPFVLNPRWYDSVLHFQQTLDTHYDRLDLALFRTLSYPLFVYAAHFTVFRSISFATSYHSYFRDRKPFAQAIAFAEMHPEQSASIVDKLMETEHKDPTLALFHARICMAAGRFDDAMDAFRNAQNYSLAFHEFPILRRLAYGRQFKRHYDRFQSGKLEDKLAMATLAPFFGGKQFALDIWKDIRATNQSAALDVLYAYHLEVLGEQTAAEDQWNSTIEHLLMLPDIEQQFYPLGESRHEVLSFDPAFFGSFVSHTFVFKRAADSSVLQREFQRVHFFREQLGDAVVQPLAFQESVDGKPYLVTKHRGETLHSLIDTLSSAEKRKTLEQAIQLLHDVQECGSSLDLDNPCADNHQYYSHRIRDVFAQQFNDYFQERTVPRKIDAPVLDDILAHYHVINNALSALPQCYYKDHNLKNILVRGDSMTLIDFEGNRRVAYLLDLVSTLEFGKRYLFEEEIKEFVESFRVLKQSSADADTFYKHYVFASVHRHLELVGYRARDSFMSNEYSENYAERFHLAMARLRLRQLLRSDLLTSHERVELSALKSALHHVHVYKPS